MAVRGRERIRMEEREAWKAEIMRYLEKGWYRRVLRPMAVNVAEEMPKCEVVDHADRTKPTQARLTTPKG